MNRGVIIEVTNKEVIVLTPDGEFCRTRKGDHTYTIGEEINFFPEETPSPSRFKPLIKRGKLSLAASFIFMLAIIPLLTIFSEDDVYGYVSIDINPSIELTVNEKMAVIDITAYNDEGKEVLKSIDNWKDKSLEDVTDLLFIQSKKDGYLTEGKEVLIATTSVNDLSTNTLSSEISKKIIAIEQKHLIDISVFETDLVVHDEARKENISPGKYGLMIASSEKGVDMPIQDVKNTSVSDISKSMGASDLKDVVGEKVTKTELEHWKNKNGENQGKTENLNQQVRQEKNGNQEKVDREEKQKERQEQNDMIKKNSGIENEDKEVNKNQEEKNNNKRDQMNYGQYKKQGNSENKWENKRETENNNKQREGITEKKQQHEERNWKDHPKFNNGNGNNDKEKGTIDSDEETKQENREYKSNKQKQNEKNNDSKHEWEQDNDRRD